jgi:hypothetical protein
VIALPVSDGTWYVLIGIWLVLGAANSTILTPASRLLRRGSNDENRPAVFAAQFSLSHACFIITYPLAGTVGALLGLPTVALILAGIGILAAITARLAWRTQSLARVSVDG